MRFMSLMGLLWASLFVGVSDATADESDLQLLRAEIEQLRSDYEARISDLERRIAAAEQQGEPADTGFPQMAAEPEPGSSQSRFNPAIGVIFAGTAWDYSKTPAEVPVPGFPFGGEAGPITEGLALGETELNFSANVDDKFMAWLTLPVAIEDGETAVEIEEAWLETTALPAGLSARFGRFYSGIGYLNSKHLHAWDFADQPLPYQAFLGDQYLDDGLQLRWVAPTSTYLELGAEVLRGGRYPSAGADNSGFGTHSLFVNFGGDVGASNSWLAGLSYLQASAIDRPSGPEDDPVFFNGDVDITGAHFIWKWARNGNWKQRNIIVQSEALWRNENGDYLLSGPGSIIYDNDQFGWYVQAVYQPFPRWRFGGRIDGLSSDTPGSAFDDTLLAERSDEPNRYSLMMDWSNSEFSRLRLQYTRDESGLEAGSQWGLQYILSIGAHGAHSF